MSDEPAPPSAVQLGPAGVIHDIGYRHYTGPRLGTAPVARALGLESLRGAFGLGRSTRSKVMPMLLLAVACLPALVVVIVVNVTGADELPFPYPQYALMLSAATALFVAGQAPASVSRDLRFRVVSLYFSRPLGRGDYVRAKYAALSGAVLLLTGLPLLVLWVGALLGQLPFWPQTRGVLQGLLGAVLLSVLLAGIGLVIAAITPRRGLGVAAVIAALVMTTAVQGALQGLGQEQDHPALAQYSRLASPFTLVDGTLAWVFGTDTGSGLPEPGTGPGLACLAGTVAVAVGCYLLLLARYRRVSVS